MTFQSCFMSTTTHPRFDASSRALEPPDVRAAVVRPFTLCGGVMHDEAESPTRSHQLNPHKNGPARDLNLAQRRLGDKWRSPAMAARTAVSLGYVLKSDGCDDLGAAAAIRPLVPPRESESTGRGLPALQDISANGTPRRRRGCPDHDGEPSSERLETLSSSAFLKLSDAFHPAMCRGDCRARP